ncbi:protein phosphatase 2C domain-containing protein [Hoyosella sp. YIM 151337]|uniref:PP2C family protein-serine/threonine phosphatase n=1 Tax=Hoyosella sp. YIM 151337 TaxID=2992742 RepID=UPI002236AA02|nr:PP2C family serine/threonine-protein phosphatase [Hoyosella sp. YIM 151337]MCW4354764.1 protein phosphatase 2C domain-containing protein [Hoyosella sp. YIM 151337]
MTLVLRYAARSDRGLVRANNEDSVYAGARLLALADGMGGHAAGEIASQLMISALAPLDEDEPGGDLLSKLAAATRAGNEEIAHQVEEEPDLEGMGTTLTAILFGGTKLGLVHVGDSRAYLMRDGQLTQITRDDTFVQSLVDQGKITAEQAHTHPQRSLIMRALTGNDVEMTLTVREVRVGDRYLLCSDGLSDVVSDETIATTLLEGDQAHAADRLIELALRSGGPDNVTVIVADVIDVDYGQTRPIVAGAVSGEEDDAPLPNTAAGRAAAMRPPRAKPRRVPARHQQEAPKKKHPFRWIALAAVLVLLVAGALVARTVVRNNYYVGESGGNVAIMRGLTGSFLGIPLQEVNNLSCVDDAGTLTLLGADEAPPAGSDCAILTVNDLVPSAREQVRMGLPVGTLTYAQNQLAQLAVSELLPVCQTPGGPATAEPPAAGDTDNADPAAEAGEEGTPSTEVPGGAEPPDEATPPAPGRSQLQIPGFTCRTGR